MVLHATRMKMVVLILSASRVLSASIIYRRCLEQGAALAQTDQLEQTAPRDALVRQSTTFLIIKFMQLFNCF